MFSPCVPFPLRRFHPATVLSFFVHVQSLVSPCACVFMWSTRDGESPSRGRGRSLTYGKEKTRTRAAHKHTPLTLCAPPRLLHYERGGDGTDEPWELPGQSVWHHTSSGAANGRGPFSDRLMESVRPTVFYSTIKIINKEIGNVFILLFIVFNVHVFWCSVNKKCKLIIIIKPNFPSLIYFC